MVILNHEICKYIDAFSVGFCIKRKTFANVSTETESEVQTIYSHALLKIHVIGGQRSVRIAHLSLSHH